MVLACSSPNAAPTNAKRVEAAVALRFRPADGRGYREHWIYDVELPGAGILRNGFSFDVSVSRLDQGSYGVRLRHALRRQYHGRDGVPEPAPRLVGVTMSSQWGSDRSLGEVGVETSNPQLAAAARLALDAARFGMLIEYPDQAVGVGDSWSIEPRTLPVGPALQATLRPSYTLEAIEKSKDEAEVVIAADIQLDLLPTSVSDGVVIQGGGTASATLRVRVRDGLLLDARTVLHFNQEIMVQGSEVLGYREFSASAHVFTTALNAQPNLAAEPLKLEASGDDEQRECAALLASATERVRGAPTQTRLYLVGALHADALPTALGGLAIREVGTSLVIAADPKHLELDGTLIEQKELAKALRAADMLDNPLYVYAEAGLALERMRAVLALIPHQALTRLVVRDAADATPPPKAPRWLEEQLKLALSAVTPAEREAQLQQLLVAHLALCDPALEAFRKAQGGRQGFVQLPAQIVSAFIKCGCTTTNLDGLEAILYAMFGSPDLRYLRLPKALDDRNALGATSVRDLARLLSTSALRSLPRRTD